MRPTIKRQNTPARKARSVLLEERGVLQPTPGAGYSPFRQPLWAHLVGSESGVKEYSHSKFTSSGVPAGGIVLIAAQLNRPGAVLAGSGLIVVGLVIGPSVGRLAAGNLGGGDRVWLRAGILFLGTVVTLGVIATSPG